MHPPSFLDLPARQAKPRVTGLTHVLDGGVSPAAVADALAGAAAHVDIWKTGWGTAYLDPRLPEKLEVLARHDVSACLGGTLLEIAWAQGKEEECIGWAEDVGFSHIEVSRGTVAMSLAAKHRLIARSARRSVVLAEVGHKDPDRPLRPEQWRAEAVADLEAGAALVVTEGRQSGSVGTFDRSGEVRTEIVDAVVDGVGARRVVFESPRADQQAWFVRRFGPEVNLGNVAVSDLLSLATLRSGLRSDTAATDPARTARSAPREAPCGSGPELVR